MCPMTNAEPDSSGVRLPPPLIYLAGLALGWLLGAWHPLGRIPAPLRWTLGGALAVAGLCLLLPALRAMRRAGTAIAPTRPTTRLVVGGPFRVTRNPLYLSLVLLYAALAVLTRTLWALILLPAVVVVLQRVVIAREEAYLERRFGDEYRAYRARVRRWI
jgi:protein-S-isoprenylcysteine O-methyltransferase Ste14